MSYSFIFFPYDSDATYIYVLPINGVYTYLQ